MSVPYWQIYFLIGMFFGIVLMVFIEVVLPKFDIDINLTEDNRKNLVDKYN